MYTLNEIKWLCSSSEFDADFNSVIVLIWQVVPARTHHAQDSDRYPKSVVHKAIRKVLTGKTNHQ